MTVNEHTGSILIWVALACSLASHLISPRWRLLSLPFGQLRRALTARKTPWIVDVLDVVSMATGIAGITFSIMWILR